MPCSCGIRDVDQQNRHQGLRERISFRGDGEKTGVTADKKQNRKGEDLSGQLQRALRTSVREKKLYNIIKQKNMQLLLLEKKK